MSDVSEQTASDILKDAAKLVADGRFDAVRDACGYILETDPANDSAMFWKGITYAEQRDFKPAIEYLQQAVRANPQLAHYHAQLGRCLIGLRRTREALEAADAAMALRPDNPMTLDTVGVIYSFTGFHSKAAKVFQHAVKMQPDNDSFWFNLGASLKFSGDFDAAEQAYLQAIKLNPEFDKAIAALAHMRRQTEDSNHIELLRKRLHNYPGDIQDEMRLNFALAKEYDDTGQYRLAFDTISDISRRWRGKVAYAIDDDARIFDALRKRFTAEAIAAASPGCDSHEPIFVVGMPRTGTTLTERIITSHSDVFAAGELNKMGLLVRLAAQARANPDFSPDAVDKVLAGDFRAMGEQYVQNTRPATGHTPHFVDKMPLNFLYVGFILLALPNAKVICVRRNPMDSCLSNFRQLFSLRSAYYAYSYDLLDCGRYYLMFDQLMRHWQQLFPDKLLQINYEDIVEQQEQKSRELIGFCGLEWQDRCMDFDKNEAPVATASSAQVRQPVYKTALARWKNYADQLQPLADLLRQNGIKID